MSRKTRAGENSQQPKASPGRTSVSGERSVHQVAAESRTLASVTAKTKSRHISEMEDDAVQPQAENSQESVHFYDIIGEPHWWTMFPDKSPEEDETKAMPTPDCCEGHSFAWALVYASFLESQGSTSSSNGERKQKGKKWSTDDIIEEPRKRTREILDHCDEPPPTCGGGHSSSSKQDSGTPISHKKKSEEEPAEPRKRHRNTFSPSEGHQNAASTCSPEIPGTSSLAETSPHDSDDFKAKYKQEALLAKGSFGRVYEGYRIHDNMPVAIKHIQRNQLRRSEKNLNPENKGIPLEVEVMLSLKPADGSSSPTVALLDWYNLLAELILVLERPVPCMNLRNYLISRGSRLPEEEVKIIVRQLVDALIEIRNKGVFHRDIKESNILIETSSDVPRVRIIDFGCATVLTEQTYNGRAGTFLYCTPESFLRGWSTAELATVWQLGVVVFIMLHGYCPFSCEYEITSTFIPWRLPLTNFCKDFIKRCLCYKMADRGNLETMKNHSWLM